MGTGKKKLRSIQGYDKMGNQSDEFGFIAKNNLSGGVAMKLPLWRNDYRYGKRNGQSTHESKRG